jgi:hypothetical protein
VTPIKVIVIEPGGEAEVREIEENLQEFQAIVGGWLEAVYGSHDENGEPQLTIFCNEEGKLKGLPFNRRATALWYAADPNVRLGGDVLVGSVIIAGGVDPDGLILSAPEEVISLIIEG